MRKFLPTLVLLGLLTCFLLAPHASAASLTWNSSINSGNWTTASNWIQNVSAAGGDTLTLFGTTGVQYTAENTLDAGTTIGTGSGNAFTLGGANGASQWGNFTITGNAIKLAGDIQARQTADGGTNRSTQRVNIDLEMTAGRSFSSHQSNALEVNGVVSGAFALTKVGSGSLVLGNASNSFSGDFLHTHGSVRGSLMADAGTNSSFGSGSLIQLGNDNDSVTLTISGSSAAMSSNRTFRIGQSAGNAADTGGGSIINNNTDPGYSIDLTAATFNTVANSSAPRTLTLSGTNTGANTIRGIIANNSSGVISLSKTGDGTWILGGANTYNGTTTISGGVLQLGNGGTTGSLSASSAITNNATLRFNRSNTMTQGTDFSTAGIGGTGAVQQSGSGTVILNAANTYSGATTITAGTLLVTGSLGTTPVTVNPNAAFGGSGIIGGNLTFDSGANFSWDGFSTLTANGASVTFGGFSGDNLLVSEWNSIGNGFHTLIDGSATFDFTNVDTDWFDIGGGREARFYEGSLGLEVIPEPQTWALIAIGLTAVLARLRRRRC